MCRGDFATELADIQIFEGTIGQAPIQIVISVLCRLFPFFVVIPLLQDEFVAGLESYREETSQWWLARAERRIAIMRVNSYLWPPRNFCRSI